LGWTADLYDPRAGTFTSTSSMGTRRWACTSTLLSNGKVLIAGGFGGDEAPSEVILASAELYDPEVGTFIVTGNMAAARAWHTATLLGNGEVLVVGGLGGDETGTGVVFASAELYQ